MNISKERKEVKNMVYVEWYDYKNSEWALSRMNIFKAIFCILFDKCLCCKIVSKKDIIFY
jgi:hypothetical protein